MADPIYLDYHSTTPCDPRVVETMLPYFTCAFGNPSSALNAVGRNARKAVDRAREQVSALICARPGEIVFTSGATESNNLAIFGLTRSYQGERRRLVTSAIDHKAVLEPYKALAKEGFEVVVLPVSPEGIIDRQQAAEAIDEQTLLVSVQAASNEIGTVQPIAEIAALAREQGAFFHTDAAQAVGKIPVDVEEWDVDFLSLSGHKLYGPKGIGALYVRGGPRAVPLTPLIFGGGQEFELRSGTLNVPGIVGLGAACRLCYESLEDEMLRLAYLRDLFESHLVAKGTGIKRNGARYQRLPNNSSLTILGIDAETLIVNLKELVLSTGSACTNGALEPSHVLLALGLSRQEAYSTIRIGMGRWTTEQEVLQAASMIQSAITQLSLLGSSPTSDVVKQASDFEDGQM